MAWQDERQPASFRGVPFYVRRIRTQHERLSDEHVLPGRASSPDAVVVAFLGQGPQRYSVEAVVTGDDYFVTRELLEQALKQPGPGIFVHPYRGRLTVEVVGTVGIAEDKNRGGQAAFTFTVVEVAPDAGLFAEADLEAEAFGELDRAIDALAAQFDADYVAGLDDVADIGQEAARSEFGQALTDIGNMHGAVAQRLRVVDDYTVRTGQLTNALGNFVTAPLDAAQAAQRALQATLALPAEVAAEAALNEGIGTIALGVLDALEELFVFGQDAPILDVSTTTGQSAKRLRDAMHALVRGSAILEGARALVGLPYAARSVALAARRRLLAALDAFEAKGPASGTSVAAANLYQALRGARAAFTAAMEEIEATLPEVREVTLDIPAPALVLAHELYGDATREAELVARLNPEFPNRLPAGVPLEVLRE